MRYLVYYYIKHTGENVMKSTCVEAKNKAEAEVLAKMKNLDFDSVITITEKR